MRQPYTQEHRLASQLDRGLKIDNIHLCHKTLREVTARWALLIMQLLKFRLRSIQVVHAITEIAYFKYNHYKYVGQHFVGRPNEIHLWAIATNSQLEPMVINLGKIIDGKLVEKNLKDLRTFGWSVMKGSERLYRIVGSSTKEVY